MRLLEFNKDVSLASVIEAIKAVPDTEVTLKLTDDTPWLKNPVNEKILRKAAHNSGKSIKLDGRPEPNEPTKDSEVITKAPIIEQDKEDSSLKDEAGFMVGGDIMSSVKPDFEPAKELSEEEEPVNLEESKSDGPTIPLIPKNGLDLGGRGSRWKTIWATARRYWPASVGLALLILLGLGWYVLYALPRADVKVVVAEQSLTRDATITASTLVTSVDSSNRKIPATVKSSNQTGTLKGTTTGKQTVGTQAKVTVTLSNGTIQDKTVKQGDKLTAQVGSTQLKFTSDNTTTIPAEATYDGTNCTNVFGCPKSVNVAVTAADIGSQYNVPVNTSFSWDTDPQDVKGVNTQPPSTPGSSKDVQVVSQADLDKLTSDLTSQLTDKAKSDLTSGNNSNLQAVDQALKTTVTNKSFDHKIGDQVTDVTLSMSLTISATLYNTQDMKDVLTKILSQAVPDGFELSQDNIETSADYLSSEQSGDLDFTGHIKANLIPKFDHDALAQNLVGKKPAAAETYLKDIPSVVSYQVDIWPNLPAQIQSFPHDVKRIHINVTVQH